MPPWWWQKVIVSQLADTSSWRGNPGQYMISCAYHVGQREVKGCSYTTDAKATSITLLRLENAHSYDVFMIMRNMEGKSSTRRLVYVIKKVQGEWWKRAECHVGQMQMWGKCKWSAKHESSLPLTPSYDPSLHECGITCLSVIVMSSMFWHWRLYSGLLVKEKKKQTSLISQQLHNILNPTTWITMNPGM